MCFEILMAASHHKPTRCVDGNRKMQSSDPLISGGRSLLRLRANRAEPKIFRPGIKFSHCGIQKWMATFRKHSENKYSPGENKSYTSAKTIKLLKLKLSSDKNKISNGRSEAKKRYSNIKRKRAKDEIQMIIYADKKYQSLQYNPLKEVDFLFLSENNSCFKNQSQINYLVGSNGNL